ncbi:hypothetical protein BH10PSE5_BH10PSE5_14060 [soil metagenome]
MKSGTSSWIPPARIRLAISLAAAFAVLGVAGSLWWRGAFVLLVPALGAGWAGFLMLRIRHQLSPRGGGWEDRIREAVALRLNLPPSSRASLLDIGCGDASLLVALLKHAPEIKATGTDRWGANWDYEQAACEARLSRLGLRAAFHRMDASALGFPDASFDLVVSVMCFHEVRAASGSTVPGPLAALGEALRVLRPGGAFVLIDRFGSTADYGEAARLETLLQKEATDLRREPLVATLRVPWPLKTKRALGPVEILSGRRTSTPER